MSRFCVRQRAAGQEAEEVNWNPTSSESRPIEAAPWKNISSGTDGNEVDVAGGKADTPRSSRIPGDTSPHYPEAIPVPASPALSAQVHSSPSPSSAPKACLIDGSKLRAVSTSRSNVHEEDIAEGARRMFRRREAAEARGIPARGTEMDT